MKLFSGTLLKKLLFVFACLITLILVAWQFENFRGRRAWRQCKAAAIARGEPMELREVIPPPVPDASNFASIPIFAPLFDFKPGTQEPKDTNAMDRLRGYFELTGKLEMAATNPSNTWVPASVDLKKFLQTNRDADPGKKPTPTRPVEDARMPELTERQAAEQVLELMQRYDDPLRQIEEGAERPFSRFPITYEHVPSFTVLLPHLLLLRDISQVLKLRSAAEIELGQAAPAARDTLLLLGLADSMRDEPILISFLVRQALLQISLQPLAEGMSRHLWSDAQLMEFQKQLQERDLLPDLTKALRGEIVFCGLTGIDQMRRGLLPPSVLGDSPPFRFMPDGWFYLEMVSYHKFMRIYEVAFDFPEGVVDPEKIARSQAAVLGELIVGPVSRIWHHRLFASLMIPALDRAAETTVCSQTGLNLAAIACALERYHLVHHAYPNSLDQIVPLFGSPIPRDLIKGRPLHYRRDAGDSYTLYSVGWNEKDDNATVSIKTKGQNVATKPDWVWRPLKPSGIQSP